MVIGGKGLKYVGILRYVAVRGVAVLFGTRQTAEAEDLWCSLSLVLLQSVARAGGVVSEVVLFIE
jgi:hypothetical protein